MSTIVKIIHSQDAGLKISPKNSGETSLNISNEIMEYIINPIPEKGYETAVSFILYKDDFIKGLAHIITNLPLYKSSSTSSTKVDFTESLFTGLYNSIQEFFGNQQSKEYKVNLIRRTDSRTYLNALKVGTFSLRNFLIEEVSVLKFSKYEDGRNIVRLDIIDNLSDSEKENITEDQCVIDNQTHQIIYYGAPGTGKSHKIKAKLESEKVPKENVFRTTFHPDSDYSTFVGAYKPTRGYKPVYGLFGDKTIRLNDGGDISEEVITYKFIPQAFLQAYTRAYQTSENVYLVIEEINRGNCAQIFGDLFQLLDRDENGMSEYTINADTDLGAYLIEKLGEAKLTELGLIKKSDDNEPIIELCLPANLYIYATMNTSDQSLFPIDSAFKRRWDWEYEPIKYKNTDWMIDIDGTMYSWTEFQKEVNTRILKDSGSEDKMMGDYFVNPPTGIISKKLFLNKVLFYLWNDVCKDGDTDIFPSDNDFSFSKLHTDDNTDAIKGIMERLGVKPVEEISKQDEEGFDEESGLDENNGNKSQPRYKIKGGSEQYSTPNIVKKVIEEYAQQNDNISVEDMINLWNGISGRNNFMVREWEPSPNDKQPFASKRRVEIRWGDNKSVWIHKGWTEEAFLTFIRNAKDKLDIDIVKV